MSSVALPLKHCISLQRNIAPAGVAVCECVSVGVCAGAGHVRVQFGQH